MLYITYLFIHFLISSYLVWNYQLKIITPAWRVLNVALSRTATRGSHAWHLQVASNSGIFRETYNSCDSFTSLVFDRMKTRSREQFVTLSKKENILIWHEGVKYACGHGRVNNFSSISLCLVRRQRAQRTRLYVTRKNYGCMWRRVEQQFLFRLGVLWSEARHVERGMYHGKYKTHFSCLLTPFLNSRRRRQARCVSRRCVSSALLHQIESFSSSRPSSAPLLCSYT